MPNFRSEAKRVAPKWAMERWRTYKFQRALRDEFNADRQRYERHALPSEASSGIEGRNLEAQLTKDYHRVEKGLALAAPKRPFGKKLEARIEALLPLAREKSPDAPYVEYASSALDALRAWNTEGEHSDSVSPLRVLESPSASMDSLFQTRRSVRNFSRQPVDESLLRQAVSHAVNTPSVCNRQAWTVRFYRDADAARVLRHQNGNRGFGESVPVVAVVFVDVRLFSAPGERNQGWIEGGLFSMSLVWALHGLGLDSCMLNLSLTNEKLDALRAEVDAPDSDLPIMMIAIGHGEEGHRIARSGRRRVDEVATFDYGDQE